MAETQLRNFEETCPCGNSVKISSERSIDLQSQIWSWRSIHNRHANAIAKAIAINKTHPAYFVWPPPTNTPPWPDDLQPGTLGAVKQE